MPADNISVPPAGIWVPYTPTWTASTDPAIGNGSLIGRYIIRDKLAFVRVMILMGSTTTYGSGQWAIGLPATAEQHQVGSAIARDAGVSFFLGACYVDPSTSNFTIVSNASSTRWGATAPHTWGDADRLVASLVLELT